MREKEIIDTVHYYQKFEFFEKLKGLSNSTIVTALQKAARELKGASLEGCLVGSGQFDLHLVALDSSRCLVDDSECDTDITEGGQYESFLRELASISRGAFCPVSVREEWDSEEPTVEITLDGRKYEYFIDFDEDAPDFLDVQISDWVNTLIVNSGIHFAPIYTGDQTYFLVALNDTERKIFTEERGWKFERYSAWPVMANEETLSEAPKPTSLLGKFTKLVKMGLTNSRGTRTR